MTLRLKGALHTHTRASDGSHEPAELAAMFRRRGYDFVFLTDHNKITYSGGAEDFLVLPGIEVGVGTKPPDQYWHFVGLCPESMAVPKFQSPDALWEFVRSKAPFWALAHPYWSQLTGRDLLRFDGIGCVEVWNTGCELEVSRGRSEYPWDWALSAGRRLSGVAVDDCHGRLHDIGKGWVMVAAAEFTADAILDALSTGAFYSSCGPDLLDLHVVEGRVEVVTSPCRSIAFIADRQCGRRFVAEAGGSLTTASYTLKGKERYVRVECVDADGRKAWSNPIYSNPQEAP